MTEHEFVALCNAHRRQVLRYARILLGSIEDAEEIVQETIALAWKHRDRYDPNRSAFGTWFITIYHNVVRRKYRDDAEHGVDTQAISITDLIHNEEEQAPMLVQLPDFDDRIGLEQALKEMGGIHERVIRMCFIGGMHFNEVASELGLTKRKVRRIITTALKRLKRILQGES